MMAVSLWRGVIRVPGGGAPLVREIIRHVAAKHGLSPEDITGPSRVKPICAARFEAIAEARRLTSYSTAQLGRFFNRDHSTIVVALKRHAARSQAQQEKAA